MRLKIFFATTVVAALLGVGAASVPPTAAPMKTFEDSMKRFSIQVPATWKSAENAEENSVSLTGDDASVIVSPLFRGTNIEDFQRRIALQYAYRSVDGPPKKNKVKWEKREVGDLKALESDYVVKAGPDDKFKQYRVLVITVDGKRHKFSILATIPVNLQEKSDLESRVMHIVDSFKETE